MSMRGRGRAPHEIGRGAPRAGRRTGLLMSYSAAALLMSGGPVFACYMGPFPYTNGGVTACITVNNMSFSGNLGNSGTIASGPTGIAIVNSSTITGQISDSDTISASSIGILIDNTSKIVASGI